MNDKKLIDDDLAREDAGEHTGEHGKKPYAAPELTQFGAMRDLTRFDPGPQEDFLLYGGPS